MKIMHLDKRASKLRTALRRGMRKLQNMGCAVTTVAHTRANNNRVYCTQEVTALRQSSPGGAPGWNSVVRQQGEAVKQLRAVSGGASPSTATAASTPSVPLSQAVPRVVIRPRGANLGVLSYESAVDSIVSQWREKRLGAVTKEQLKLYLEHKGFMGPYLNKEALLHRAAAFLSVGYPEGKRSECDLRD